MMDLSRDFINTDYMTKLDWFDSVNIFPLSLDCMNNTNCFHTATFALHDGPVNFPLRLLFPFYWTAPQTFPGSQFTHLSNR